MQQIVRGALAEYERHEAMGALPSYPQPWSAVSRVEGLTTVRNETTKQCRIFGRVGGEYRDFIDFYYAETAKQLFEWNKFMFGHAVDAAVLTNIHVAAAKKQHLYLGLKWTCFQPSAFSRKRDNCFLEYLIYTKDLRGRDIGVRVTLPVDIPECPDLSTLLKVKRIKTQTVTIVRPATDQAGAATHFFMMSDNDFAGFHASARSFKKHMNIIKDTALFVDSKRISKRGVVSRNNWVPKDSRRRCSICTRNFGATRRKHHCRLCGDVFCKRCIIQREIPRNLRRMGKQRTFKVVKRKFCKVCVTSMRESESLTMVPPRKMTEAGPAVTEGVVEPQPSGPFADFHDLNESHRQQRHDRSRESTASSMSGSEWSESDSEWSENGSEWSETDSECGRTVSFCSSRFSDFTDAGRSSWSTTQSDDTVESASFVSALDMIDSDTAVLEEEPAGAAMLEIAEEIDTTDMLPASQLVVARHTLIPPSAPRLKEERRRQTSVRSSATVPQSNCRRGRPIATNSFRSASRSLDQCLAEQQDLLRQMVLAANGMHTSTGSTRASMAAPKAHAAPVARPKIKLYDA